MSRKKIMWLTSAALLFIALLVFCYWLLVLRFEEYTDDAYVHGNMVELTPQVSGIVASINVDNTDYVEEGQVLIELDKTDYIISLEKSKNQLGETVRNVTAMFLKVAELYAELEVRESERNFAQQEYENRTPLVPIGAVSKEEFEQVEATLNSATSRVREATHALQAAFAQVQGVTIETHPLVLEAAARVKDDFVSLRRCDILSPVNGFVAQRSAQLGEWVNLAKPLLAIIPLNELWIDANFKEVQLADFRIGQEATIRSDIYGREVTYKGTVVGINPGTGNTFSALPPQNATGNWIKIVQRVPVRISLNPKQLQKFPLWLGLSMNVTVDIRDTSGEMLAEPRAAYPIYQTGIYRAQEEGADELVRLIIEENRGS